MLAIAALASCAKEEVIVADQGELIGFNSFVENATRANDLTYGAQALTEFYVYGTVQGTGNGVVNIFAGDVVTGVVGEKETITDENGDPIEVDKAWSCDVKQYWIAGAQYNFAAVVDVNNTANNVTVDNNGMPTTIAYTTANQNDLLYATASATGQASGNGKVNFTFNHLLSKVQFTVKSNTTNGYHHNVTNIKVNNFEQGTYTIADGSWVGTTAKDISLGDVKEVTAANTTGKTNETQMLLVPTTNDFTVSFTVEIWNGTTKLGTQDYTKTVSQDLVAGNAYDFNLNLSVGELIEFTVTEDPEWNYDINGNGNTADDIITL